MTQGVRIGDHVFLSRDFGTTGIRVHVESRVPLGKTSPNGQWTFLRDLAY